MKIYMLLCAMLSLACTNANKTADQPSSSTSSTETSGKGQHWEGAFTNGMKKTYISFDVSADGKQLQKLTFNGYWYCDGSLTQDIMGPQKSFSITGNKVDGVIVEPEGGGASATRYELHAVFNGSKAEGTFRMNINGLGCDTYKLNWTAEKK
ncbi:MAG: hypothetical protein ACTHOF_03660 [Flavisolibacter sp.]